MTDDVTQGLAEVLSEFTQGMTARAASKAALAYLANVEPDAGPEHQCGGPQEACCIPGCPECGQASGATVDNIGDEDGALVAYRCFVGWTATRAALAASQAEVEQLKLENISLDEVAESLDDSCVKFDELRAELTDVAAQQQIVADAEAIHILLVTLDSLRAMAEQAITHQTTKGGQNAGIPRMAGVPMSTLRMIERDCRHTIERMPPALRASLTESDT